jgi:hypothetical protein
VYQILAAIIRDFWVIEDRERVFTTERRTQTGSRRNTNSDKPRIVYLPRINYTKSMDTERCAAELGHQERRAHFVRPHLRRSSSSSNFQMLLADRYGFDVPEGYTFVRPHERGAEARETIYRSRSALQSLYTATQEVETSRPNRWFQFERDVMSLMSALGFQVQHVAVGKRGDRGIDVFATKGNDLDLVNWIIQCKCWGSKRTVSPNVVRELIGTLVDQPQGTRGMIVTTSRFSSGSIELADQHTIRLINGEEFVEMTTGVDESEGN